MLLGWVEAGVCLLLLLSLLLRRRLRGWGCRKKGEGGGSDGLGFGFGFGRACLLGESLAGWTAMVVVGGGSGV